MAETSKNRQPEKAGNMAGQGVPAGHRHEHPERVSENGREVQNDPRPDREKLEGTPLGSDPRE